MLNWSDVALPSTISETNLNTTTTAMDSTTASNPDTTTTAMGSSTSSGEVYPPPLFTTAPSCSTSTPLPSLLLPQEDLREFRQHLVDTGVVDAICKGTLRWGNGLGKEAR
eukprot:GHVS01051470.1.p1 GENE.GHVS01051470.1~~GHVS01051470.1.p1  ORF type:complete len:110 (-),score=18.40 GHVS01051470.1:686-1015(-)